MSVQRAIALVLTLVAGYLVAGCRRHVRSARQLGLAAAVAVVVLSGRRALLNAGDVTLVFSCARQSLVALRGACF
jgi:hypothetical protein